ncbi:MAG TPA: hypothetical protein VEW28_07600 [Candidatus Kapabacteria bacterium]|nr:hypothetical protein [Candidatus Kapabacteria bacterium]
MIISIRTYIYCVGIVTLIGTLALPSAYAQTEKPALSPTTTTITQQPRRVQRWPSKQIVTIAKNGKQIDVESTARTAAEPVTSIHASEQSHSVKNTTTIISADGKVINISEPAK